MSRVASRLAATVAWGSAAAAGPRQAASAVPILARQCRRMRAALRLLRAAEVRPVDWGEAPVTGYPAATDRWFGSGRARALSATTRKTAGCALAWRAVRPRPARSLAASRCAGDRARRLLHATAVRARPVRRGPHARLRAAGRD